MQYNKIKSLQNRVNMHYEVNTVLERDKTEKI